MNNISINVFNPNKNKIMDPYGSILEKHCLIVQIKTNAETNYDRLLENLLKFEKSEFLLLDVIGAISKKNQLSTLEKFLNQRSNSRFNKEYYNYFELTSGTVKTITDTFKQFRTHDYWTFGLFNREYLSEIQHISVDETTDFTIYLKKNSLFRCIIEFNLDMHEIFIFYNNEEKYGEFEEFILNFFNDKL